MHTTITVNGPAGSRFLSYLGSSFAGPLPAPLVHLLRGRAEAVEVESDVAEHIASLVERVLADAIAERDLEPSDEPPLLFSPNVGDGVAIVRDVLVELQPPGRRAPRIWRFIPRGTRGRVIAREAETDRVLLESSREVVFVRPRSMTGTRFWSCEPPRQLARMAG